MKTIAPNYYERFHCIADKCKHSCCIGWEIDIDEDTLDFYQSIGGPFGDKLRQNIDHGDTSSHFKLVGTEERCPFLQENGLCEMILMLGEHTLCDICREHPRFYHILSDRDEIGLGLCCEEATRLILSQEDDTSLITIDDDGNDDTPTLWECELYRLRAELFSMLQCREKELSARTREMLAYTNVQFPQKAPSEWYEIFSALEQLDPAWGQDLAGICHLQKETFDDLQKPMEKLLLYFLYRYTADAKNEREFSVCVALAYLGYYMISLLCAAKKERTGICDFHDLCEFSRRYSSEIEYSEENTEALRTILS